MHEMKKPAPLRGTGLDVLFRSTNAIEIALNDLEYQASRAARALSRRFGLPVHVAQVIADRNGVGGDR